MDTNTNTGTSSDGGNMTDGFAGAHVSAVDRTFNAPTQSSLPYSQRIPLAKRYLERIQNEWLSCTLDATVRCQQHLWSSTDTDTKPRTTTVPVPAMTEFAERMKEYNDVTVRGCQGDQVVVGQFLYLEGHEYAMYNVSVWCFVYCCVLCTATTIYYILYTIHSLSRHVMCTSMQVSHCCCYSQRLN